MFNEILLEFETHSDIMCIKMNKHYNYAKILIMYHYLICCKLKFNIHLNNN
jgi:hypothetical protein